MKHEACNEAQSIGRSYLVLAHLQVTEGFIRDSGECGLKSVDHGVLQEILFRRKIHEIDTTTWKAEIRLKKKEKG